MAEKIKISDLFDFSDVQDLETLYRRLEQINQVYKNLANSINQESKVINKGLEENVKTVSELATALKQASDNADIKKLTDQIEQQAAVNKKLNAQNEKLIETNKKLKDSQKAVNEEGKEAERLLKEQEKLKAKISAATGEEAKQNAILKLELQRVNKEVKEQVKQASGLENAYQRLVRQTREAKNEAKRLGAELGTTSDKFVEAQKKAQKLDQELKDLDASVGDFQRNVGNYQSALDGIGQGFSSVIEFATPAGLALAAVAVTIEGIGALADIVSETNEQLKETAQLTGLSGDALTDYTSKVRATANVFDQEYKDVLRSANAVSKEFGITGSEALDLINQGFVQGANINDDYLDQLREYSTQFKAAGLTAQDFNNVVALGAKEGIFNDKAADTVKEAGLRLREFTKATSDSLIPLGKLRNEQIKQAVAAGDSFKAIQLVSQGLKEVDLTAQQTQAIITNTFGGPGEDAGIRFIELLGDIKTGQDALTAGLTEQQKQQLRVLEIEQELANAEVKLGEAFKNSGKELSIFFKQVQTLGIEAIVAIIDDVKEGFDELAPLFSEIGQEVTSLTDALGLGGGGFVDFLKKYNPVTIAIKRTVLLWKALLNVVILVINIFKDFVADVKTVSTALFNFATSFEPVNTAVEFLKDTFNSLLDLFKQAPQFLGGLSAAFTETFVQIRDRAFRAFGDVKDVVLGILTFDKDLIVQAFKSNAVNFENGGKAIAAAFRKGFEESKPISSALKKEAEEVKKVQEEVEKEQAAQTSEQAKKDKEARDKVLQDKLKAIDDAAAKEKLLKTKQREDDLSDEELYQIELLQIRLKALKAKKEVLEQEGKDTTAIEQQIEDEIINQRKKDLQREAQLEKERQKQLDDAAKNQERKRKEAADKRDKQREDDRQKRAERANDPILQAGLDALETRIENELLLAGVQAFRSSLEQGATAQEALQEGVKAVAAAQVFKSLAKGGGFHDGGYTGDGGEWEAAGIVHKGEHVITKAQTSKYGLKGLSAKEFDTAVESGYFTQFAKTNSELADQMNYNSNIVVMNDNKVVADAIERGLSKIPTEQLKPLGNLLQHQQKMGSRKITTTFANSGRTVR